MTDTTTHWQNVYETKDVHEVSWFQAEPTVSLRLITTHSTTTASVVDCGGGASLLVDQLLNRGYTDVTVVDVSSRALDVVRQRLADADRTANLVTAALPDWTPQRTFDVWHDRAAFHFITNPSDQSRYVELVASAVTLGGHVIIGTFAEDGPTHCSGLEIAQHSADQLAARFADHFELIHHEREEHVTPNAAIQRFTWVVLKRR